MLLGNYHARDHGAGDSSGSSAFDHGSSPASSSIPHTQLLNQIPSSKPDQSHLQMLAAAAPRAPAPPAAGVSPASQQQQQQQQQERRLKPHSDQVLKCPRCDSMNTKFCYYNNYSLTQPRHFCKNCKRYWTKGGALRNVPVGGGCRKNKRVKQQRQQGDPHHPQQQQQQSSSIQPPQAPEDHHHHHHHGSPGGNPVAGLGLPGDGASSSSLEPGFPGGFELPKTGGMSLSFDRVELPRLFNQHQQQQPISINWAAGHQIPHSFEGSILGLNLSGGIKQEPVHGAAGEHHLMFDHSILQQQQQQQEAAPGMNSFVPMESFTGVSGEVLWRFPQQAPKLVSLLEDGSESHHQRGLIEIEGAPENSKLKQQQLKSKMSSSCTTSDYDQGEDQNSGSPPEWHQSSDGFFDSGGGETGYWSNGAGAWTSTELHSYGAGQPPGNHQLL